MIWQRSLTSEVINIIVRALGFRAIALLFYSTWQWYIFLFCDSI